MPMLTEEAEHTTSVTRTVLHPVLPWIGFLMAGVIPFVSLFAAPRLAESARYPALPIRFEPSGTSEFRSHGGHQTVVLGMGAVTIQSSSGNVVLKFPGSDAVAPTFDGPPASLANYFLGSDPAKWRTNVPAYSRVRYRNLYPGIDVVFYGDAGRLEYDFVVSPGADPSQIRVALGGAGRIALTSRGDLAILAPGVEIGFLKPNVYQDSKHGRQPVAGSYQLTNKTYRFKVGNYDHTLPLVIDPALTYATFFGGTNDETADAVATDASGNTYVAGYTRSTNLPVTAGAAASQFGGGTLDCFVAEFSSSGTLLYSTYLGGSGDERAFALTVDSQGNAYVTGNTTSANFPVTQNAYDLNLSGASDAFVAKISSSGSALLYSSFLGGSGDESGYGIALDGSGDMFIAGATSSSNFPVSAGSYSATYSGGPFDAFVTAIRASGGSLLYSTYLGGADEDQAFAIALDQRGNAYVTGETTSANFPNTPGIIQPAEHGSFDAFVASLNPSGTALNYSTLLGGTADDYGCGIAVDSSGNAYVTGYTYSPDFPHTPGALQQANAGGVDAFVTKIAPSGTALVYSTFLGGSGDDYALPIAIDSGGNAYITGDTTSTNFPVTSDAAQLTAVAAFSAFVAVLNSDGSALSYGTYLGGSISQTGWGIAVSPTNEFIAVGYTASQDFPVTAGAYQPALAGPTDAFLARFSALHLPVLSLTKTHSGNFAQGQTGATYSVVVSNSVTAGPTSGAVTVTETVPTGLTLVSMTGIGWTCSGGTTCTRSDSLAAGSSYPTITITVNVAANAQSTVGNQVSISGGGSATASTTDSTNITAVPLLGITSSHTGNFTQGKNGATYTLTVSNAGGATSGTVTVTETIPAGLTLVSMAGTNWVCPGGTTCTRSDSLAAGSSYPTITITVNVAANAQSTVGNQVSVSGGGSATASTTDSTSITAVPLLSITSSHTGNFNQGQNGATYTLTVNDAGGATSGTVTVTETIPAGLTLVSMAGTNWICPGGTTCTRSDSLAAGSSYPTITVTVNVAANAQSTVGNQVSVSGGGSTAASTTDSTNITAVPLLSITSSHTGNFTQGQNGATYTLTVSNAGGATSGTVTVTETIPAGLTLVSMAGTGWTCSGGTTCTRSDSLAAGSSYPTITVTVNVAANAQSTVGNQVSVSGGGSATASTTDSTNITAVPLLGVTSSHTGNFTQGKNGATYTLTVSNAGGATSGTVTVTETIPAGLTLVSMAGTNWVCPGGTTCTRSDSLAAGSSYPAITVAVNVSQTAASPVSNQVTVSGGGSALTSASDSTSITQLSPCDVNFDGYTNVVDVQLIINEALGVTRAVNDLNNDGVVNVVDIQIIINAALGLGCSAT